MSPLRYTSRTQTIIGSSESILLSLARRPGQKIRIGEDVVIVVREVRGQQVKLGIEAPAHIRVLREEIFQELSEANKAATQASAELPRVLSQLKASKKDTP